MTGHVIKYFTSGDGARASTEAVGDPGMIRYPSRLCLLLMSCCRCLVYSLRICRLRYQPLVPDVKKQHLSKPSEEEPNEEKRLNIKACISAFEKGEEIRFDELFCKGKMNWND